MVAKDANVGERRFAVRCEQRAFLGDLVYSFARVSAMVMHRIADYYTQGPRSFFRLLNKGGRSKAVSAQEYVDACLEAARIGENRRGPLFRSCEPGRHDTLQSLKVWSLRETVRFMVPHLTVGESHW